MEKPQRFEKKLIKTGLCSRAVVLPAFFLGDAVKVVIEVFENEARIIPVRKSKR